MKKLLLGAAAALAISAPGVAAAQSGYIDLGYQNANVDVGGIEAEGDGYTVGGAAAWGGEGSLGVQVNAIYGTSEDVDTWNLGGHVFTRNDSRLFGAFLNYGNADVDGADSTDSWSGGVEGQWYVDRATVDAAVSYSEGEEDVSLVAVDLGFTGFATDNFSYGFNVGYGSLDDGTDNANVFTLGAGVEYQLASTPISVFGGWQRAVIDDFSAEADTLSVGVRYNFGGTLIERSRHGASLSRGGGLGRFSGLF